ncbi:MAG: hypothetical protein ACJAU3_001374 [Zhongshania sp.]|jgi:hypothetical protein
MIYLNKVAAMENDKRKGEVSVPDNAAEMLNEMQLLALRQIEGFGWRLHIIRRPLFQEVVAIVIDSTGENVGILEEDGSVDMAPAITLRENK